MQNIVNECQSPLRGIQTFSHSAFVSDFDEDQSPFSFRDIFKRKNDESESTEATSSSINKSSGGGSGIISGIIGLLGGLAPLLPQIGVGSKSRIAEATAIANANASIYSAQSMTELKAEEAKKERTELLIIGGVVLLVLIIFFVAVLK